MEKYRPCFFVFVNLLLPLYISVAASGSPSLSPLPPECHEDERSALLEFKQGFKYPPKSYFIDSIEVKLEPQKFDSWKLGNGNCCTWDGVECDANNGHVVGLELCCTGLRASINSTSSLFRLVHLRNLNLAYTNFDATPIPSAIGKLSKLASLNLSASGFRGPIPQQVLDLANLSYLDLSYNQGLQLIPSLGDLLHSLSKLEKLDVSEVNVSSSLTNIPANLSSLCSLVLRDCGLHGQIPSSLFSLPNLLVLDMDGNALSGNLPELPWSSSLRSLSLSANNFSGMIPASVGNSTQLIELDLSSNGFQGLIPPFSNRTKLRSLVLEENRLTGSLPSSLGNLFQLRVMRLNINYLTGRIPPELLNMRQLDTLLLAQNMFSETIHLDKFLELSNLEVLHLGFNNLSVVYKQDISTSQNSSKIFALGLSSCKLRGFPRILLSLDKLLLLGLTYNNIEGEVPTWFQEVGRETLVYLNLSCNSLTGFSRNHSVLSWKKLEFIDIRFNKLQGALPLPPEPIVVYHASDNRFSGEISQVLCTKKSLKTLDLANYNFTGVIPKCLANLAKTLSILSLHSNDLSGQIPGALDQNCSLKMLGLNNNRLQGPLPRSLSSCTELEFLNFGDNMIEDTFPSWLGTSSNLKVLILRSNRLYGEIPEPVVNTEFPALRIIDLSRNNFGGRLPAKYFQCWKSMRVLNEYVGEYIGENIQAPKKKYSVMSSKGDPYAFTMTIVNKGIEREYTKILDYFQVMDFSSNNFIGEIPNSTASLTGLRSLNLSNNFLSGPILTSLGSLVNLEALDLSMNELSGQIPQQLTQLNFLSFFNVSENCLSGHIPQRQQFDLFKSISYEGNEGLCGNPLSKVCSDVPALSPPSNQTNQETDVSVVIEWKAVVLGYAIGILIGAVIGHIITARPTVFARAALCKEGISWRRMMGS